MLNIRLSIVTAVILLSICIFLYYLNTASKGNGNSLGVVNSLGLSAVVIGIIAAGLVLRRATPRY